MGRRCDGRPSPGVIALVVGVACLLPATSRAQNFARGQLITLNLIQEDDPPPRPQGITLADVNNDQRVDLVSIAEDAEEDAGVAVMLGNGDGTFGAPTIFVDSEGLDLIDPVAVAVADVGAPGAMPPDGNPDIIAIDFDGFVVPLFGNGSGGFTFSDEGERFDAEPVGDLTGLAVDNFDNRNGPDIALTDNDGQVLFFCSTEFGTFDACPTGVLDSVGDVPVGLDTGDLDGDGDRDVVVVNQDADPAQPGRIVLFRNGGDGSFEAALPALEVGTGNSPSPLDVAVGRFDGDSIDDAAVVFVEDFGGDSTQIFLGRDNGRLSAVSPQPTTLAFAPNSVEAADFDGDGNVDLASTQADGEEEVFIARGDGSGDFPTSAGSSQGILTGPGFSIAVGDLNGDDRIDFVVGLADRSGLRVGLNTGDVEPTPQATETPAGTSTVTPTPTATRVPSVPLGPCDVTLGSGGTVPVPLAGGDLDRDGDVDLVTVDRRTGTIYVVLVSPQGLRSDECSLQATRTFSLPAPTPPPTGTPTPVPTPLSESPAVAVGDVNRDGRVDIAVAHAGGVTVLLASGADGDFTVQPTLPAGADPRSVAIVHRNVNGVSDLNADNLADLVVANHGSGNVSILHGRGDGMFSTTPTPLTVAGGNANIVLPVELNNDATIDLAVATDDQVVLFEQAPLGTFTGTPLNVGGRPTALAPIDFVPGGAQEVLVVVRGSDNRGTFAIIQRNQMNNFIVGTTIQTGPRPTAVGMGRFDGVGSPLNVVIASDGNQQLLFHPFQNGTFGSALEGVPTGPAPSALVVADFDADGQDDVAVTNSGNGTLTFLRSSRPPPTVTPTATSTPTPTPSETPIQSPSETPVPSVTRSFSPAPTRTPKPGTFELSGDGCAIAPLTAGSGNMVGLLIPVAILLVRRRLWGRPTSGGRRAVAAERSG